MKLRYKDLVLAMDHIAKNSSAEWIEVENINHAVTELRFTDKAGKLCKVILYESKVNATPDLISTQKLYRKD